MLDRSAILIESIEYTLLGARAGAARSVSTKDFRSFPSTSVMVRRCWLLDLNCRVLDREHHW